MATKKLKEKEEKCQDNDSETKATTSTIKSKLEGGLVFAKFFFEPLDTL